MNIYEMVSERTKGLSKILIKNSKEAFSDICNALLQLKILLFFNFMPVLDMINYKKCITEEVAIAVIRALLTEADSLSVSDGIIKDILERLRYSPQLQIDLDKGFRLGQMYVNCKNGVYDITKKKLTKLKTPIDFSYIAGFEYIPNSELDKAPHFKQFILTSVGMENLPCLLRILGYCVSSLTKGRRGCLLIGKGKTGKSVLLNVLQSIFDPDLVSHQPFHLMGTEKSRWHYYGKRINISRDNSSTPMKDEEAFKSLISCEETIGREVYQKYINFTPTLKFIFASNWPLCFAHPDEAVYDRLVVIRFTRTIPDEMVDFELEEKLKSEVDVIFSLAVDTLKELIESKYDFQMADDAVEYLAQQRSQVLTVQDFFKDEVKLDPEGTVGSEELYTRYVEYCSINSMSPMGRNTFKDKMRNIDSSIKCDKVYDCNRKRVNGYKGIRFATVEEIEAKKR
ncbi:phage/plasmid primase, P4 family, C-terminal domain-containing protein [Ruminococcus sp. YRD2003]|uniref:DNA primase family protein n=1 Tax=Ruminococcus sp. YRD2003 TaxID=1452313 RepID=UPI0008BA9C1B|nr:phage/plasmid primase, P4 family, C-terminal domain-containing protein [Ruminococcus flavefaciens]